MKKPAYTGPVVVTVIAFVGCERLWAAVELESEHRVVKVGLTPIPVTANDPPPDGVTLYESE